MNRLTLRGRLTLVYVVLIVVTGGLLVGTTYVLVSQGLSRQFGPPPPPLDASTPDGPPTPEQIEEFRQYARDFRESVRESALTTVLTRGAVALVVVTVLASLISWLLAGRALQPLHRITATARRIAGNPTGESGLRQRISLTGPQDEVKELADTFDDMLGRLHRAFDAQRRFVANASHELRTPLAVNRSLIEVAITRPDASADAVTLGHKLLGVNERHTHLVDALLVLAESENFVPPPTRVDLMTIVRRAVHTADTNGLLVQTDIDRADTVGDPIMLERIVHNLLDNAARHNLPGGWVFIHTGVVPDSEMVRVIVRNSGTLVSESEAEAIFEPFRRLRSARTGTGVGLGLSIVRAIATAHGGSVRAEPIEAGGLHVEVTLPASSLITPVSHTPQGLEGASTGTPKG